MTGEELIRVLHPVLTSRLLITVHTIWCMRRAVQFTVILIWRCISLPDQGHFIVGYQDAPDEVIIAPVILPALTPAGTATTIDNTNALHAYRVGDDAVTLESVNGSSFYLSFEDNAEIATRFGVGLLEQGKDVEDFREFVTRIWPVL